ncbi:MAG: phosphonoacetaldehyde reductase [Arenicella sp.]
MNKQYWIAGYNALQRIGEVKNRYAPKKTLLVTGKESFSACGAKTIVDRFFRPNEIVHFNDFAVNPRLEDGEHGASLAIESDIDLILAIGGGSAIDIAKLIKALISANGNSEALVRAEVPVVANTIPLIAVPTTAGSGSEATHFAVAYIGKDKFSVAAPSLLPTDCILDGSLLISASPYQRAINGLDALAQAIEGCWAVASTVDSRRKSLQAIELLVEHLPKIINGSNEDDLQSVMLAANLAGRVINVTKTTAAHAFSYAFTSFYGVPHGHAVWLTLPEIFAIHHQCAALQLNDPRGYEHVAQVMQNLATCLKLGNSDDSDSFAVQLKAFMRRLGVEPDMELMGISTVEQRAVSAQRVNVQRLANNPVVLGEKEVSRVFNL